jgi:hypothetical protein
MKRTLVAHAAVSQGLPSLHLYKYCQLARLVHSSMMVPGAFARRTAFRDVSFCRYVVTEENTICLLQHYNAQIQ